ncbi:YwiC-like family protein [Actinomyces trachealis]|uniref:YwiC-like family protein n=1 Tax=Actinomyces trachealis TaxID=2763540 RepID=UPI0018C5F6D9|nr:YwiC-like family protein [Actinomyces trachealis]
MTQQRPSNPSDLPAEHVSAAVPANRPASAPSHQSLPGPEDDILLSTGRKPTTPPPTQEQIRRQPGRRPWVPNQHGAWAMLLVPALVGLRVGGVPVLAFVLLPAWWAAYFTYWAWSQWLRTRSARRRHLLVLPLGIYTAATASLGLFTLLLAPYLAQWLLAFAPLLGIALWELWRGRERSLLSGLATTTAASLMTAVSYSAAVRGGGGFLGLGDSTGLRGASPNGELTGWPWVWLLTASVALYFGGTVPYVKTMIRERFNRGLLVASVAAHTLVAAVALELAATGFLNWGHALLWVGLAVRAWLLPHLQWRRLRAKQRPLASRTIGIIEIVVCVLFLLTVV